MMMMIVIAHIFVRGTTLNDDLMNKRLQFVSGAVCSVV